MAHECAGEGEVLALCEADLGALGPCGAQLRLEAGNELPHDVGGARSIDGCTDRREIITVRQVTDAHRVARPELELEGILKPTRQAGTPGIGRHAPDVRAI